MEEKDKLKLLQKKYKISDKDLLDYGLKQEETINECTKVSPKEKEKIREICLENEVTVSRYLREMITSLIYSSPDKSKKIAIKIKDLECEKKSLTVDTPVPFVLTKSTKKELVKFCKKHKITNRSSIARYIIIETVRRGGKGDILS